MKVQIEISEKAFNLAVAQSMALVDSEKLEQAIKKAEEFCKINTIAINNDNLGDKKTSFELQLGLAVIAIAQVADETA